MKQLTFILLLVTSLLSCTGQMNKDYKKKLRDLAVKENTVIVDVRSPQEFSEGHLPKAVNMPLPSLADSVVALKKYENIIVVCRSGGRSAKAEKLLKENGFTNVYDGGGWGSLKAILEEKDDVSVPAKGESTN